MFHRGCEHVLSLFSRKSPFLSLLHTWFSLPLYLLTSYLCTCPLLIFAHWCILLVFYIPLCLSQIYLDSLEFSVILWCHLQIKCMWRDFSGGPVVKNLPGNAGDTRSITGWVTKIPRAEQLSPCAETGEAWAATERSWMTQWRYHVPQQRPDAAKYTS